jgi:putative two-component system response regulator
VHDIGKACVPDEIIKKPKPSSAEMALIRRYPEFGADLLGAIPAMQPVAQIVAAHQERWNGSGYPQGSVRTEIPVAAQIVALCDVYDVLSTARRYRPAYSQDRALQIIKQNVGTLWNPDIARVFLIKIVGEGPPLRAGAKG